MHQKLPAETTASPKPRQSHCPINWQSTHKSNIYPRSPLCRSPGPCIRPCCFAVRPPCASSSLNIPTPPPGRKMPETRWQWPACGLRKSCIPQSPRLCFCPAHTISIPANPLHPAWLPKFFPRHRPVPFPLFCGLHPRSFARFPAAFSRFSAASVPLSAALSPVLSALSLPSWFAAALPFGQFVPASYTLCPAQIVITHCHTAPVFPLSSHLPAKAS